MRHCKDYLELISAYADGELSSASEIRDLEAHLAACQNCTAFHSFTREISDVTGESLAEPPSEFISLVMNQVRSEPAVGQTSAEQLAHGNTNPVGFTDTYRNEISASHSRAANRQRRTKPRNLRLVMTRLVPIAASLALVVLVWQFWGGFGQLDYAVAPETATIAPAGGPADFPVADVFSSPDEYLWRVESEDEMVESEGADEADGGFFEPDDYAPPILRYDAQTQVAFDVPSTYVNHNLQLYLEVEHANIFFGHSEDSAYAGSGYLESYIPQASFIIALTYEFIGFLDRFEPDPIGQVAGWDKVFVITTDSALLLLSELMYGAGEYEVIEQNINKPYAIVLLSR